MIKNNFIRIAILLTIVLCMFGNSFVFASPLENEEKRNQQQSEKVDKDKYNSGLQDPIANPDTWKPTIEDEPELSEKAGKVLGYINVIGIISSVIVMVVLGIKYLFGSLEEKATYKKDIFPYLIGVFMLLMSTTLPNIIYKIVDSIGNF